MSEFVNLEFIGTDGTILRAYAFPKHSSSLSILKYYEPFPCWIITDDAYVPYGRLDTDLMEKVHYVRGIFLLENLKMFWMTTTPPHDNVLLRFDRWPEVDEIVTNVPSITLPKTICPVKRFDDLLAFCRRFLHLHRKLVEVALAFLPILIPSYVVMWICDFLPLMNNVAEWKKMQILLKIKKKCYE